MFPWVQANANNRKFNVVRSTVFLHNLHHYDNDNLTMKVHLTFFLGRLVIMFINVLFFRLAGSYEALEAGNTGDALVDFTGGVCESINLKDGGYSQDVEKRLTLFKSMERATREKSLISASIRVDI